MRAEKIAGVVGIGDNLINMLHKPHNLNYKFVICIKAVKRVRNNFRNVFKTDVVSLLIA